MANLIFKHKLFSAFIKGFSLYTIFKKILTIKPRYAYYDLENLKRDIRGSFNKLINEITDKK